MDSDLLVRSMWRTLRNASQAAIPALMLALLPVCNAGAAPAVDACGGHDYRYVSIRPDASSREQAIAVDEDGKIALLALESNHKVRSAVALGYEALVPPDFRFARTIPKDEVPVKIRRIRCPQRAWTLWVVTTYGFIQEGGDYSITNYLYVFRESGREESRLLRIPLFDVIDLVTDDINADGLSEIAVQYEDGEPISPSTWLKIWQVNRSGDLSPVSLKNVEDDLNMPGSRKSLISLGDYKHGDTGLYSEQESVSGQITTELYKYYTWRAQTRSYAYSGRTEYKNQIVSRR